MFGLGKPAPEITLTPFAARKTVLPIDPLCEGLIAANIPDFAHWLAVHRRLQGEHPGMAVLGTLDDFGQASYTSAHASEKHMLDATEGHDLSALPAECFEDGEHLGILTHPAEFPIRLINFLRMPPVAGIAAIRRKLAWDYPDDPVSAADCNGDPDAHLMLAREREIIFQFVPVQSAAEALAAFPNGYFTSDLSPPQVLALARHLHAEYALSLAGVGSRFLAFTRPTLMTRADAGRLANEVCALYDGTPAEAADLLMQLFTGRHWLLLRYTES